MNISLSNIAFPTFSVQRRWAQQSLTSQTCWPGLLLLQPSRPNTASLFPFFILFFFCKKYWFISSCKKSGPPTCISFRYTELLKFSPSSSPPPLQPKLAFSQRHQCSPAVPCHSPLFLGVTQTIRFRSVGSPIHHPFSILFWSPRQGELAPPETHTRLSWNSKWIHPGSSEHFLASRKIRAMPGEGHDFLRSTLFLFDWYFILGVALILYIKKSKTIWPQLFRRAMKKKSDIHRALVLLP